VNAVRWVLALLAAGALLALLVGCPKRKVGKPGVVPVVGAKGRSAPSEPGEEPAFDLSGEWLSPEWGEVKLSQEGAKVTGTYFQGHGHLVGQVKGRRIEYKWWEDAKTYDAAERGSRGTGYFEVEPNTQQIKGQRKQEGAKSWAGAWSMERGQSRGERAEVPEKFQGTWHDWRWGDITLHQSGEHVTGKYTHNENEPTTGHMDGRVEQGVFRFAWWENAPTWEQANKERRGEGEFRLKDDGTLEGEWGFDENYVAESFPKLGPGDSD